jgi:hypothetical protein
MSTRKPLPSEAGLPPSSELSPDHPAAGDPSAPGIGSLVCDLQRTINVLEEHVSDMNYAGTDEFNAQAFPGHPFDDNVYHVLHDLADRVQQLSDDLYSAAQERRSYAGLSPQQQKARTDELEQETTAAQADQAQREEWQQGASARERAWAALPPELTAPGRYERSGGRCATCGGRIETINDIHRCWACFRRDQAFR